MGNLAPLGEAGIRGAFREGLETEMGWAAAAGVKIPSDSLIETHRWMGTVPQLREYTGSTVAQALRARGLSVENKQYDASVYLYRDDIRRDKTGQILATVESLGQRVSAHWEKIAAAELETNPTGWDSVALFASTHSDGKSGTINNLLTNAEVSALNVATAAAPSTDEAIAILIGLAAEMYGFKDDQGEPANVTARTFGLVAPVNLYTAFSSAAARFLNSTGGDSDLTAQRFRFDVYLEPRLTSTTVVYPFVADAVSKGLILQSEVEPTVEVDNSDWIKNRRQLVKAYASRRVAPGDFRKICKATLS